MVGMLAYKNYLCRISAVLCVGALAEGALPATLVENHLVPMSVSVITDVVPNVRINAAKTIQAMHKTCKEASPGCFNGTLIPALKKLVGDEDPDVKFFANKALSEMSC